MEAGVASSVSHSPAPGRASSVMALAAVDTEGGRGAVAGHREGLTTDGHGAAPHLLLLLLDAVLDLQRREADPRGVHADLRRGETAVRRPGVVRLGLISSLSLIRAELLDGAD